MFIFSQFDIANFTYADITFFHVLLNCLSVREGKKKPGFLTLHEHPTRMREVSLHRLVKNTFYTVLCTALNYVTPV
jgi:hypothetical protein